MKLRKLILSGFKSFADRTEFEFHDGITCVVGPNGCGKSNIVDAIKWVLGEQSAKSLRGSEMMDIIFNGSAVRRPSGMAEVALVFDDPQGVLTREIEADVRADGLVSVTRRLYRGGHSEYLINNVVCRLKDIREMFMDTGIGVDAYSVIEQGRVEMFLNASTEDRRSIFDEAAGISRYKARKKEALRKLDRVEQNLYRINDILGEVEKRLRSVKLAAGKARNYQTHVQRLKELKSLHYLAEYYLLAQQRGTLQGRIDTANDQLAAVAAQLNQLEAAHSGAQAEAADLDQAVTQLRSRQADVAARHDAAGQRRQMYADRVEELTGEIVNASHRCEELEAKLADLMQQFNERQQRLTHLKVEAERRSQTYQAACAETAAAGTTLRDLQDRLGDEKDGTVDLLRRTAQLHSDVQASTVRRESLAGQQERLTGRAREIAEQMGRLVGDRAADEVRLKDVRGVLADSQQRLEEARRDAAAADTRQQTLRNDLTGSRERRSAVLGRVETLEEMLAHLEGLSAGTRDVLEAARSGSVSGVRGMLGDFIRTHVEHAGVVEAALAGADQYLLAARWSDIEHVAEDLQRRLSERGSAEIICLDRLGALAGQIDAAGDPNVIAHVMDWVRCESWLSPVIWRLLGKTLVTRTLADAVAAKRAAAADVRFVTLTGEVLEPDGRVRLGAAHRGAGVIRRRSELAELRDQLERLDQAIIHAENDLKTVAHERERLGQRIKALRTAIYEANTERVELEGRVGRLNEQVTQLQREEPVVAADLASLTEDIEATVRAEHEAREAAAELERARQDREAEIERLTQAIGAAQQHHAELSDRATELKVQLAQAGEQRQALADSLEAMRGQQEHMQADLDSQRRHVADGRQRRTETEDAGRKSEQEIASLAEQRDQVARDLQDAEASRRTLTERVAEIRKQLNERRSEHDRRKDDLSDSRSESSSVDARIDGLISRASDEMNMELVELVKSYQHDDQRDWQAVEAEIADLNQKIERLGNVNLDAITEQDELEQRQEFLTGQLADVNDSQRQLNDLIDRLNAESHQRFCETFEAVRINFQQMFRKLFGGGKADLILLDDQNVLECGIEIVARPPGKDLKSLTLLSGGEKAKTALALIFSFFASRPSPFCLLDEVDAPLDEANTEQFGKLLRTFADDTQVIIISHAKRTMSMVDVLYGVTMQEPGVSTRISVRFEEAADMAEPDAAPAAPPADAEDQAVPAAS